VYLLYQLARIYVILFLHGLLCLCSLLVFWFCSGQQFANIKSWLFFSLGPLTDVSLSASASLCISCIRSAGPLALLFPGFAVARTCAVGQRVAFWIIHDFEDIPRGKKSPQYKIKEEETVVSSLSIDAAFRLGEQTSQKGYIGRTTERLVRVNLGDLFFFRERERDLWYFKYLPRILI
jgi:hypothetical protein